MTDIQKAINDAYAMISYVPVSGDYVDVMSDAREKLRIAYKMAAPKQEIGKSDG